VAPEYESLAEMLKKSGYTSARIGKWHIGDDNQGFDFVSANGEPGFTTNFNGEEKRFYDDIHVAEKMTDTALKFMEDNKDKPFFLYLSHWEVHTPIKARKERIEYFKTKKEKLEIEKGNPVYAAEIEQVDLSLGRVTSKLEELGVDKNTVVIFTSDNGGVSAQTSNLPLRAGKGTYYEGGIRVPFCIKWPGVTKSGTQSDVPINGVDFMPTFAQIASAEFPQNQPMDGTSFVPLLKGEPFNSERPIFFHFPLYIGGGGKDKILPAYDGTPNYWRGVPSTTILSGDWKLIYYYEYDSYELFNLKNDISEKNDLSESETEIAEKMLKQLKDWVKRVEAPVPNILNN
jgi:arylsulfatase A-like enzyme